MKGNKDVLVLCAVTAVIIVTMLVGLVLIRGQALEQQEPVPSSQHLLGAFHEEAP